MSTAGCQGPTQRCTDVTVLETTMVFCLKEVTDSLGIL